MDSTVILAVIGAVSTVALSASGAIAYLYQRDAKRSDEAIAILAKRSDDCEQKHDQSNRDLANLSNKITYLTAVNEMICPKKDCPKMKLTKKVLIKSESNK